MKEISQIEIYEALKGKLGENEAKLLVEYIESKKREVATKEDIQRLEEIVKMVEKSTKEEIRRLENEINELRKEQRRNLYWILGFHITLWATTIAGIITILLKIKP
jgi:cytochrome b subunit of formate dehydrogenase